jgi:hypothetical protein
MFRVCVHYSKTQNALKSTTFKSESFETKERADEVLASILEDNSFTGGNIEEYVRGIGWVVADE